MLRQNENDVNLCNNCVTLLKSGGLTFEIYLYSAIMLLLNILIVLIVAGVLLWLVNSYIPMDGKIKTILNNCGCDRCKNF